MAATGLIVICKLRLDEDAAVLDLGANGCQESLQGCCLLVGELRGRLGVLDGGPCVCSRSEDLVDIVAEGGVVDEAVRKGILGGESRDLGLAQSEVEGAEAGAELNNSGQSQI